MNDIKFINENRSSDFEKELQKAVALGFTLHEWKVQKEDSHNFVRYTAIMVKND